MPNDGWWHAGAYGICGLASVAAVLIGVRRHRPPQPVTWWALVAGLLFWLVSAVVAELTTASPWNDLGQLLGLAGYPCLGWALINLLRGRTRSDSSAFVDAGIVATSLGLLYWIFIVGGTVTDSSVAWSDRIVTLATAAGDIILVVLISLLITTPGARTTSYRLLLGALLATLISDIVYVVLPDGDLLSTVFSLLGDGCVAAATLHPSMRQLTVPAEQKPAFVRPRLALLAVTILLPPVVGLFQGARGHLAHQWLPIDVATIILFLLVTLRMTGLLTRVEDQSRRLSFLVNHDPLTGLANRRHWDERLRAAMEHSTLTGETLIVALLDLDHFKRYNDTHGHQSGDELLTQAAAAWRALLRREDLLSRYGGEEFCLLLTGRTIAEATEVVERLMTVTPYGQTFSAGLVAWDGSLGATQLLAEADRLLYLSKDAGRARVTTGSGRFLARDTH